MISRVTSDIKDTKSGVGEQHISGIHGKIGVSPVVSDLPIRIRNTMDADEIRALLGNSPLADACMDSIDGGAETIYCLPIAASAEGKVEASADNDAKTAKITASGTPCNGCTVLVEIMETGAVNLGTFRASCDGGVNYTEEMTIPLAGEYTLADIGVKLTFASDEGTTFQASDVYTFECTAPTASNEAILNAAEIFYKSKVDVEFLHVVGTSNTALWAALETMAKAEEDSQGRPILMICEQRLASNGETAAEYVEAIKSDCKSADRHVGVVQSNGIFTRIDGRTQHINLAGFICGMISRAKESTSIAYVRDFEISESRLERLLPEGIEEHLEALDEARYITVRRYAGKDAWYVTSANTCADADSDFAMIENARVMYRLVREVNKRAIEWLNADFDASNIETELVPVQADLNIPVDDALADQIISAGEVTILDSTSILEKDVLPVRIMYTSRAYARNITLTFMAKRA